MTSRAFSLCCTAWVATYTLRRHQLSRLARQRPAQLIVDAGSRRLQGLQSASCSFRRCAFHRNRPCRTCAMEFARLGSNFFWTFLWRNFQEDSIFGFYRYRLVWVPSFSEIGWGASGRQRVCGRESVFQRSLPCKLYDEIGLGLLMLA